MRPVLRTGPVETNPDIILRDSALTLYASGQSKNRVAKDLGKTPSEIDGALDPVLETLRGEMIALARKCKKCLGPAEKDPEHIRAELRMLDIPSAMAIRYEHGIMAGPAGRAEPGHHFLIEFRRFSTAPGNPRNWLPLASWAFLNYEDRELALDVWINSRGLPTSNDKRHWGGLNRPLKIILLSPPQASLAMSLDQFKNPDQSAD